MNSPRPPRFARTSTAWAAALCCGLMAPQAWAQASAPAAAPASAPSATPAPAAAAAAAEQTPAVTSIVVTGIRTSQQQSIALKRNADTVVDSISAQDIGKLPDVTIADSLQRVSGVQIRREAGEGSTLNIRGLPQVGTLLNGEEFLTAGSITRVAPDYSDIPSQLFRGADVYKSATGKLLGSGISGTVDLRTLRPFDLPKGWTRTAAAEFGKGSKVSDPSASVNGLVAWRDGRSGVLGSAVYSDTNAYYATEGLSNNFRIQNEGATPADQTYRSDGVARGTVVRGPNGEIRGYDMNGDGDVNDAFFSPGGHVLQRREVQRKRLGLSLAGQTMLTDDLTLTAEAFHTKQDQYTRRAGIALSTTGWTAAQFAPGVSTPRTTLPANFAGGSGGYNLSTVQRYDGVIPNFDSYNETNVRKSSATNLNIHLEWDNGGALTLKGRAIHAKADNTLDNSYAQFSLSDGTQWNNGVGSYPTGNRAFNPGGYRPLTLPVTVDYSGASPVFTFPASFTNLLSSPQNYALKTISSENNSRAEATNTALRLDGNYKFGTNLNVDFGARYGERSVENFAFDRLAPMYAGNGASDPAGCLVKWKAFDVQLGSRAPAGGNRPVADCFAGPANNPYTAGVSRPINDPSLQGQFGSVSLPGAPTILALNMNAMDNPAAFHERLYPGEVEMVNPALSYSIDFKQTAFYLQGNFKGTLAGMPYRGNAGLRQLQTEFKVRQNIVGANRPYGAPAFDIGDTFTTRRFNDSLPALNFAIDPSPNFRVRAAYAENMTILDLQDWAGGLSLQYGIDTTANPPLFRVLGGDQLGNTRLDPWRSKNFDLSFEWYNRPGGIVSLALYKIDMKSSVGRGTVVRPDLPDLDGVVRNGANVSSPLQAAGNSLSGFEVGVKQRLDFLPGLLRNLGVEATYTRSKANTQGNDLAGSALLFQDNSPVQTNFVLWYEANGWQARVARSHRGKRLVENNFAGIPGLAYYQDASTYVDASLSYDFSPKMTVFVQGTNLTNEYERYYLTWPDQKRENNLYERKITVGLRAKF